MRVIFVRMLFLATVLCGAARAQEYLLPPPGEAVVGELRHVPTRHEETLLDVARQYHVGFRELRIANPGVDPWLPGEGTQVILPTRYVLPDAPRKGIVVNIPEMRLYYYPEPRRGEPAKVITYPISVGRRDWNTPLGVTRIVRKVKNPSWRPPKSIREEHAARGEPLPAVVPPGPDNPLGDYALRLGLPGYLIHGTNKPDGIGMQVTHGCIRMFPEDIESLYRQVGVNTPVRLVDQPFKAGWRAGELYL
jgi:L,D-transpeptidase ErfK/SrfK